jgi:hypothetical protein
MKYLVLPFATAILVGVLSVATAAPAPVLRGSGCSDNPYSPNHTMNCGQTPGAAKKKNALIKHHTSIVKHHPSTSQ